MHIKCDHAEQIYRGKEGKANSTSSLILITLCWYCICIEPLNSCHHLSK